MNPQVAFLTATKFALLATVGLLSAVHSQVLEQLFDSIEELVAWEALLVVLRVSTNEYTPVLPRLNRFVNQECKIRW